MDNVFRIFFCRTFNIEGKSIKSSLGVIADGQMAAARGAESQTWARGHLKYDGFPVLLSPKQAEKILQFGPKNDVISKKKGLYRNSNGFSGRN